MRVQIVITKLWIALIVLSCYLSSNHGDLHDGSSGSTMSPHLFFVSAKSGASGGDGEGSTEEVSQKERKQLTEIRDGAGIIILRLLIIQGVPLAVLCICCYKLYKLHKEKYGNKDNNYQRHQHSADCEDDCQEGGE